jgi:hypothetical protein
VDAERFGRMTKALGAATIQRRALEGLTVGALAGLFGWHEADPTNSKSQTVGHFGRSPR